MYSVSISHSHSPDDLQQAYRRHGELVDKKFLSGLSPDEQAELQQIQALLDEAEAKVYEPVKRKLQAALTSRG